MQRARKLKAEAHYPERRRDEFTFLYKRKYNFYDDLYGPDLFLRYWGFARMTGNSSSRYADLKHFSYGNLKHPSPKSVKRVRLLDDLGFSLIKDIQ